MAEPVNDEGKATARAQQEAYLAGLRRERDGYASRGDRHDKAHEVAFSDRVKEVEAEISRVIKEMETGDFALSTLGRPEGPAADDHRPNLEVTETEPVRTPPRVRPRPVAAAEKPKAKASASS